MKNQAFEFLFFKAPSEALKFVEMQICHYSTGQLVNLGQKCRDEVQRRFKAELTAGAVRVNPGLRRDFRSGADARQHSYNARPKNAGRLTPRSASSGAIHQPKKVRGAGQSPARSQGHGANASDRPGAV